MANTRLHSLLHLIRRTLDAGQASCPDRMLLERFVVARDEAAFETILRRHGPMVLDVCRSLLPNEADVEDAFQATFLILARKARSIRRATSLASWLHGVAYRVACKARTAFARRHKHEANAISSKETQADDLTWRELRQIVHDELDRLPGQCRDALALCYLEGMTQDQAAAELDLPKGTLKGHLERGRALLRARLVRRGLGPTGVLLVFALPTTAMPGALPTALVASTAKASTGLATGQALVLLASPPVVALVQTYLHGLIWKKVKLVATAIAVLAVIGLGSYGLVGSSEPPREARADPPRVEPAPPPQQIDDPGEDLWTKSSDKAIALRIAAEPREAKFSEATTLNVWLRNLSKQPIRVVRPFGYGAESISMKGLEIRGQTANLRYTGPHEENGFGEGAALWLQPGASIQDRIVIRNASKGFRLRGVDMPAVHTITIEYLYDANQIGLADVWKGKIQSKSVTAEVKPDAP